MKNTLFYILTIVFILTSDTAMGQHHEGGDHAAFYPHSLGLFVGYTFIPADVSSDEKQSIIAPTIGLDYFYKFNHKIALGFLNDIELASYEVEKTDNETLKKNMPMSHHLCLYMNQ